MNVSEDETNAFVQNAIVISTYDFVADNEQAAKEVILNAIANQAHPVRINCIS